MAIVRSDFNRLWVAVLLLCFVSAASLADEKDEDRRSKLKIETVPGKASSKSPEKDQEFRELEVKYAYTWARVRSLPDEQRHAALEPLLREAEEMSPRPILLICDLAERLDQTQLRVKYAREWVEKLPESINGHAELVAALSVLPKSDESSGAMKSLLTLLGEAKSSDAYETAMRHLLSRNAEVEAAEVLVSGIESETLDPVDALLLSLSFQRHVHPLLQVKQNESRQAKLAVATQTAVESIVTVNLKSSTEYVRTDVLMIFLGTYASALKFTEDGERPIAFLDRMTQQVQTSALPDSEKEWCVDFFDEWKVRFLYHAGRKDEAIAHARERANREIIAYQKSDKRDATKVLNTFADCFEVFHRGQLRELMTRYETLGLDDPGSMTDKFVTENSDDEEERSRVERNQSAWIGAQKQYYLRMLAEREYRLAAVVAAHLSELTKFIDRNDEPVFDADSEYGEWMIEFAGFAEVMAEPYMRMKTDPFGLHFNLENEFWLRGEPLTLQDLEGKVVIVSLCSVGSSTDPRPPRTISETKAAIDIHLSEEGLDGSGPEITGDGYLGQLYEAYPRESLEIIGLVDDDYDSGFGKSDDQWHPAPASSTKYILNSLRANHPVVYTYQSKFLDALISDGQPRLIVFDQQGRLVRVIDGLADSCEFETLQETVERLLKLPAKETREKSAKEANQ